MFINTVFNDAKPFSSLLKEREQVVDFPNTEVTKYKSSKLGFFVTGEDGIFKYRTSNITIHTRDKLNLIASHIKHLGGKDDDPVEFGSSGHLFAIKWNGRMYKAYKGVLEI